MAKLSPSHTSTIGFVLILSGTVLGLSGTDLVLPAVPSLPSVMGGTAASAQFVLAAYTAGSGAGLLLFGELGARHDRRLLLARSLLIFSVTSIAASLAPSMGSLIFLRLIQGAAGSAAAVFAPGIIRAMYDDESAIRAFGLLGSLESLTPALAPIAGAGLLAAFGWQASFWVTGALALCVALGVFVLHRNLPQTRSARRAGGYLKLAVNLVFLRYALSQAFTLGGLLVFVFGAPAMIIGPLQGTLSDFILMQVCGIAFFIFSANAAGAAVKRFGAEPVILAGTLISAVGAASILIYSLSGGADPRILTVLIIPLNLGLGLRGPPGFLKAVLASGEDDARGAALVMLAILLTAAAGTAAAAPFVTVGLTPLAGVTAVILTGAVVSLLALPRLDADVAPSAESQA